MQVFNANDGRNDTVKHSLVGIVRARFFRFQPTEFSTEKALRVEVYGILTTTGKLCKDSCLMSVPVLYTLSLISVFINQKNHKRVFFFSIAESIKVRFEVCSKTLHKAGRVVSKQGQLQPRFYL